MFNILSHQGNTNQNIREIPPHTSQNGEDQNSDSSEDVEKVEHPSIVGGIESWYNDSGNQSGSSSENWA